MAPNSSAMPVRILASFCLLVLFSLFSCVDSKDYDLGSLTLTPDVAFPLAYGDIGIVDLVTKDEQSYIKAYTDGLAYLYYAKQDTTTVINRVFRVPTNTSNVALQLPAGTIGANGTDVSVATVTQQIDLGLSPAQLSEMLLKSPSLLTYNLSVFPTNNSIPYQVNFTLLDVVDKATQVPMTFSSQGGLGTQSLNNYVVKMDRNKFNVKLELIIRKHSNSFFIASGSKVNAQISFTGMSFSYIKGFFGDQSVVIPPNSMDLSIFNTAFSKAKITFVQPKVSATIVDPYGVPLEVNFTALNAVKGGTTLPITISPSSPVTLTFPTVMGNTTSTTINVTNAAAVLDFAPSKLSYAATARMNKGLIAGANFLTDTAKLRVKFAAEVPLYGKASGISLLDTLSMDFTNITQANIKTASLLVKSTNEMPLDANVQMYLYDKNYVLLDSLLSPNQTYIIKGSTVNATTGELQAAGTASLKLELSSDRINKLFSTSHLVVKAILNTSKDANGSLLNVKFKTAYRLKLNIGLLSTLSVSTK